MAYVKVAVKKKTGPKQKVKPIDSITLMTDDERNNGLRTACEKLVNQFKENDNTMKQVHSISSKIKSYNLDEMKAKGMNPDYFRMVSNKADGMTAEDFINKIPENERYIYRKHLGLITQYIVTIKDSGAEMVNKANVVRDLIKDVKAYDVNGENKTAKIVIDYYRKIYNAKKELREAIGELECVDKNTNTILNDYDFIKELYLED